MFDWDRFGNGEIAVHCDTEEKAKDFLKECEKRDIGWSSGKKANHNTNWDSYKIDTCYSCYILRERELGYGSKHFFKKEGLEIIKWEIDKMKELTFKEVIANIKDGEVWENASLARNLKEINRKGRLIRFVFTDTDRVSFAIYNDDTFILQRKEYSFEEAFKAYEEGKEIESCYTATKFCENEYLENNVYAEWKLGVRFKVDEIKGKWYINEVD